MRVLRCAYARGAVRAGLSGKCAPPHKTSFALHEYDSKDKQEAIRLTLQCYVREIHTIVEVSAFSNEAVSKTYFK